MWPTTSRITGRLFIGSLFVSSPIEPEQLAVGSERVKEIRTTVASLRLDAIAGAGFGTSRTKMAKEIKAERVKVNWQSVTNPSASVAQGDVISIRGQRSSGNRRGNGNDEEGSDKCALKSDSSSPGI